ncbi:MAG: hypothetical protein ACOYJQ_04825 [Pseudochelatococcus sp.]|uniref:hypothetical protein n=1 Tax=Pseudochelatococcus sp. TaxID=2020869 RepID=UPI003D90C001
MRAIDAADASDPLKSHIAAFQSSQKELLDRNDLISTWLADRRLQQVACAALASPDSTEDRLKGMSAIDNSNNGPIGESSTVIERLRAKVEDLSTKHKLTPQEREAIYRVISKSPDGIKQLKLLIKQKQRRTAAPTTAPTPAPATATTARAPAQTATTPPTTAARAPAPTATTSPATAAHAPAPTATTPPTMARAPAPTATTPAVTTAPTPAAATRVLERLSADADYRRDNPPSVRSSILDFLRAFLDALGELSVEDLAGLEEIDDAALLAFLRENDCADWLDLPATGIA